MDNIYPLEEIWINLKTRISQKLAIQESADKKEKTLDEMLPTEVLDYKDVFDKQTAERFPELRPWDHAIDLKEDFVAKDCKIYPLSPLEQLELDKFIDENLAKGKDHQNLLWFPHSSLSTRRMESYDPVRITRNSMKEPSRTPVRGWQAQGWSSRRVVVAKVNLNTYRVA